MPSLHSLRGLHSLHSLQSAVCSLRFNMTTPDVRKTWSNLDYNEVCCPIIRQLLCSSDIYMNSGNWQLFNYLSLS